MSGIFDNHIFGGPGLGQQNSPGTSSSSSLAPMGPSTSAMPPVQDPSQTPTWVPYVVVAGGLSIAAFIVWRSTRSVTANRRSRRNRRRRR